VGYKLDGDRITQRPASLKKLAQCTPVYQDLPGWKEDISRARSIDELPSQARTYVETIEKITGIPVSIISVGPDREETIMLQDPFS